MRQGSPSQLRPSTPLRQSPCTSAGDAPLAAAAPPGALGAEEVARRFACYETELAALRGDLAAAKRALSVQEGARVALAAELDWAREAARGAQVQRATMEVLLAKNAELAEQVRATCSCMGDWGAYDWGRGQWSTSVIGLDV